MQQAGELPPNFLQFIDITSTQSSQTLETTSLWNEIHVEIEKIGVFEKNFCFWWKFCNICFVGKISSSNSLFFHYVATSKLTILIRINKIHWYCNYSRVFWLFRTKSNIYLEPWIKFNVAIFMRQNRGIYLHLESLLTAHFDDCCLDMYRHWSPPM